MSEEQDQPRRKGIRVPCPIWSKTIFVVVADGIEIKCHPCHSARSIHHISRAQIEEAWRQLEQAIDPAFVPETQGA